MLIKIKFISSGLYLSRQARTPGPAGPPLAAHTWIERGRERKRASERARARERAKERERKRERERERERERKRERREREREPAGPLLAAHTCASGARPWARHHDPSPSSTATRARHVRAPTPGAAAAAPAPRSEAGRRRLVAAGADRMQGAGRVSEFLADGIWRRGVEFDAAAGMG